MTPLNAHALWEAYLANWTLQPGAVGIAVFGFVAAGLLLTKASWKLGALCAALFSHWYVGALLHDAPRIIDAGTYWFQSKHLFGLPLSFPSALYRGRFLMEGPDGALHGIFPPGYPTLLALFQELHAPMLLGPVLAALLVWRTYLFTMLLGSKMGLAKTNDVASLAAALCATNLCLRYHTADTMSHGLTALLFLMAMHAAVSSRALIAGLFLGAIACTRMGSLPAILLVVTLVLVRRARMRSLAPMMVGMLPGLMWLAYHQWLATGSAMSSTQLEYYARSDGPAGCFGWGLSPSRGCLFEHGDYTRDILPHGLTLQSAVHVTTRRFVAHCKDFLGFELLSLAGLAAIVRLRGTAGLVALLVPAHMAAYAMFYFDGNYPGGGSRFFAELLPLEFSLLSVSLATCARQAYVRQMKMGYLLASMCHGTPGLLALRDKFGASPMLSGPAPTVKNDLQFLVNEHAVRERQGDLHLLASPWPQQQHATGQSYAFEVDDFWPMRSQKHGYAVPRWEANTCASGGRVLALHPEPGMRGEVQFKVPFGKGRWAEVWVSSLGIGGHGIWHVHFHDRTFEVVPTAGECQHTSLGLHQWTSDEDDFKVEFDSMAAIDSIVLVDKTP